MKKPIPFKRILVLFALFVFATINSYGQDIKNLEGYSTIGDLPCFQEEQISNRVNPQDLYRSARTCTKQGNFDNAFAIYGVALSFSRYDALRVPDVSARQAANYFRSMFGMSLSKDEAAKFMEAIKKTGPKQICPILKKIGPPDYYPMYMVAHGLQYTIAISKKEKPNFSLVTPFDSAGSWEKAINEMLHCDKQ